MGWSGLLLGIPEAAMTASLNLRIVNRTSTLVTLAWDKQDCNGFRYYRNDKPVATTYDGTRTTVRMTAVAGDTLKVVPLYFGTSGQVKA